MNRVMVHPYKLPPYSGRDDINCGLFALEHTSVSSVPGEDKLVTLWRRSWGREFVACTILCPEFNYHRLLPET